MATVVDDAHDYPHENPAEPMTLVAGEPTYASVTETVSQFPEGRTPLAWYVAFGASAGLTLLFFGLIGYLFLVGVGVWGNNSPVFWAFPIVNFVFWVGIGHAGTLISAILFLFRQNWRTSINRFAEAMTIFAVACAGIFPGIHIGRIWFFYYLLPYYDEHLAMWPNFRSPLVWDVFAVSTYATVSLLFWYMGMIPDLATFRDRAKDRTLQFVYGILALGWTGSARHWHRYEVAYMLLAALATPLVLSVHTIVSFDFAVSQLPGWHTTIFPPYFVAGAIFSGFAMVVTLIVPAREMFGLKNLVTMDHLENINKIILATSFMVGLAYATEFFMAYYGANYWEQGQMLYRPTGDMAWAFWIMASCNVVIPQLFWFKAVRRNLIAMFIISIFVNIGMWFERFVITVLSLKHDFLPSSWGDFAPTAVDLLMLLGSFGLFFTLFLLFVRFLPIVAVAEVKSVMPHPHPEASPRSDAEEPSVAASGAAT